MRGWEDIVSFPEETVGLMREIIRENRETLKNRGVFVNTILREDVFDILNACCTVVFYPFPEERTALRYFGKHKAPAPDKRTPPARGGKEPSI